MARTAGIDGCPIGWLRLERHPDGDVAVNTFASAHALFADLSQFDVMAIDIPIGLPDASPRICDPLARAFIQPRGSSVFPAPVRATLAAETYDDACARSIGASGKSLSKQTFAILPKIREVDAFLHDAPAHTRAKIREVHPEVSFRLWNGAPVDESKKSGLGFALRFRLVESRFPGEFTRIRAMLSRRAAADDDILDAFAALWTAERVASGTAISFPVAPIPTDAMGLPMAMFA